MEPSFLQRIQLDLFLCFLISLGLLLWADWRIALGVFLMVWGNNVHQYRAMLEREKLRKATEGITP